MKRRRSLQRRRVNKESTKEEQEVDHVNKRSQERKVKEWSGSCNKESVATPMAISPQFTHEAFSGIMFYSSSSQDWSLANTSVYRDEKKT